jgi:hypothetical protein
MRPSEAGAGSDTNIEAPLADCWRWKSVKLAMSLPSVLA